VDPKVSSMPRCVPVNTYEQVPIVPPISTGCPASQDDDDDKLTC